VREWLLQHALYPGLCTRNLLRALTDYNLGICSSDSYRNPTHHSGAMLPMQNSVRVPILQPFKALTTKSNA